MLQTSQRASWWNECLASLVVGSGVGYLAVSYTISRWLTRSSKGRPELPAESSPTVWHNTSCRTSDGLTLQGWCAEPPAPRGTVMLFHGLRGNRGDMLERIRFLTHAGFRCLAFDHRGHGESDGKRTSFGWFEARDALAVMDYVDERWPSQPQAALGFSMGAASLCFAAERSRRLDAVILESLYHDLASAFQSRVGRNYPSWFARFTKGVRWVTEKRLGVRIEQLAPVEEVEKLAPAPVLFVTGTEDPHAPVEDVERLYRRCREAREMHIIPGAAHFDVCEKGGKEYRDRIVGFLERNLAKARAA